MMQVQSDSPIEIDGIKIEPSRIRGKISSSESKPFYYIECEGEIRGEKNQGLWKILGEYEKVHKLSVGGKKHSVEMSAITYDYKKDGKDVTWFCLVFLPVDK